MKLLRRWSALLATIAVMSVSAFANTRRINGFRTGEVSDRLPTGFTPAGFTFSIWSVIYIALLAFSFAQIKSSRAVEERGERVRGLFLASCGANIAWVLAWHHLYIGASFAIMLVLLGCLIAIRRVLARVPPASRGERWLVDVPFSIYAGWILTATIANLGALLSSLRVYPFGIGMDRWALVSVAAAVVIYMAVAVRARDLVFSSVFLWVALGIALKSHGISEAVRVLAMVGAALVVASMVAGQLRAKPT